MARRKWAVSGVHPRGQNDVGDVRAADAALRAVRGAVPGGHFEGRKGGELMAKRLLRSIDEERDLYRDDKTGIAWVADRSAGIGHSCHSNIDASGSVRGMKDRGYWNRSDHTVRSHGFIYNIDSLVVHDEYDEIARQHCRCGGYHGKPLTEGKG